MDESHLLELMQLHGVKPTANRIVVAKTLMVEHRPLTMTELEERIGTIDKSGIFRTLTLFKERNLVHVLEDADGTRYELCHSHSHLEDNDMHLHFHCERCGCTICLEEFPIPAVNLPQGFTMQSANFVINGLCPKCSGRHSTER